MCHLLVHQGVVTEEVLAQMVKQYTPAQQPGQPRPKGLSLQGFDKLVDDLVQRYKDSGIDDAEEEEEVEEEVEEEEGEDINSGGGGAGAGVRGRASKVKQEPEKGAQGDAGEGEEDDEDDGGEEDGEEEEVVEIDTVAAFEEMSGGGEYVTIEVSNVRHTPLQ